MRSTMAGMTIATLAMASAVAPTVRGASHGSAAAPYTIQQQYTLGSPGGWDYLSFDAAARHLYISRADRVLVMNAQDGSLVAAERRPAASARTGHRR